MSQIEVPKLTQHAVIGPSSNEIAVSKLAMFVILQPGDSEDTSNRQGHVHTQIMRRG
jgi:hypothetical protein